MKFSYDNEADVPADLKQYYKEVDGKWVLQCEGAVSKVRLEEFRTNNINLEKENRDLKEKFKDIDPEEARHLKTIKTELEDKKLKEKDLDKVIEQRVGEMKTKHEREIKERDDKLNLANTELSRLKISDAAVTEATRLGLRAGAKDDLVARVSGTFRLEGGKPVAFGTDGQKIYGSDGGELTIKEAVEKLTKDAPHLFEPSEGTGANGTQGKPGSGGIIPGRNPWSKDHWNLTQQGQIVKTNPKEAVRLAKAAGKTLRIPGLS